MKRKTLISVVLVIIMLLSCISPVLRVYATESSTQTITLNSELYTAVSTYMKSNYTGFAYNDLLRTITANGSNFSDVTKLELTNSDIDDITGLEVFTGLKYLDLSGNELSLDSNLEILNGLTGIEYIDFSTNEIDGFNSWLTLASKDNFDYDSQKVKRVTVIKTEIPYTVDDNGNKIPKKDLKYDEPKMTGLYTEIVDNAEFSRELSDGNIWEPNYIEHYQAASKEIIDVDDEGNISCKLGMVDNSNYYKQVFKEDNYMYHLKLTVTDSTSKFYGSTVDNYVIVAYDDEEVITFKDENFYKSVKKQLKKGQSVNSELQEFTDVDRLFEEAYDTALTLVIDQGDINNNITSLLCDNERISDLTGLEYFVGLESSFSAKYNYIDSIEKIVELEENKAKKEEELRKAISEKIAEMNSDCSKDYGNLGLSYTVNPMNILDNYKALQNDLTEIDNKEYADKEVDGKVITAEEQKSSDKLAKYKAYGFDGETITEAEESVLSDVKLACSVLREKMLELYDIKKEGFLMRSYSIPELYDLDYDDIDQLTEEEVSTYLTKQIDYLKNVEQNCLYYPCLNYQKKEDGNPTLAHYIARYLEEDTVDFDTKDEMLSSSWYERTENGTAFANKSFTDYLEENKDELNTLLNSNDRKVQLLKIFKFVDNEFYKLTPEIIKSYFETNGSYDVDNISKTNLKEKVAYFTYMAKSLINNNNAEMLAAVIKLPRLKAVDLSYNNIEGLEGLDKIKELERINFNSNLIVSIDNVNWSELTKLYELSLSNNQLTNVKCLEKTLKEIISMDLSENLLSGKFDFEFWHYPTLETLDFSGNSYTDLSLIIDKYKNKVQDGITTIKEALPFEDLRFHNQVIKVNYGTVNPKNGNIELKLPAIFEHVNKIDPYNTTYGVSSKYGSVEQFGELVKYTKFENGDNSGYVIIDNIENNVNNATSDFSIGYGTICYVDYNIGGNVAPDDVPGEILPDQDTPTTPPTGDDNKEEIPEGTQKLTAEDVVIYDDGDANKFIFVYKPDATVASLADVILKDSDYGINRVNDSTDFKNDKSRLYTSESVSLVTGTGDESTVDAFEVVVVGDIDGDGDIDSIDSGYARALRYDSLYKDIEDKAERIELMNAFKATSNFRAADMTTDGTVDKVETRAILYYRAGLINDFKEFVPKG